jgi:hypothetical protein
MKNDNIVLQWKLRLRKGTQLYSINQQHTSKHSNHWGGGFIIVKNIRTENTVKPVLRGHLCDKEKVLF